MTPLRNRSLLPRGRSSFVIGCRPGSHGLICCDVPKNLRVSAVHSDANEATDTPVTWGAVGVVLPLIDSWHQLTLRMLEGQESL